MKLKLSIDSFFFHYQFPITVGAKTLDSNFALKITIENKTMLHLASLPHFHHHTLNDYKLFLEDFFLRTEFDFSQLDLKKPLFNSSPNPPSDLEYLYCAEAILYNYLFHETPTKEFRINGLYHKDMPIPKSECLKIKIRPNSIQETIEAIKTSLSKSSNPIVFRLDGNQQFTLNELIDFLKILRASSPEMIIEYIEEPFIHLSDLMLFKKRDPTPLALDENLITFCNELNGYEDYFFICKPSLLSLSKVFSLSSIYAEKVIISSSYEFPSAMKPFYDLASLTPRQYHGLDTIKFLPKNFGI